MGGMGVSVGGSGVGGMAVGSGVAAWQAVRRAIPKIKTPSTTSVFDNTFVRNIGILLVEVLKSVE